MKRTEFGSGYGRKGQDLRDQREKKREKNKTSRTVILSDHIWEIRLEGDV